MTGEVTLKDLSKEINTFLGCKQLNTFDHSYHIRKSLDSEPLALLVNRYIIFNKFDEHIQLHMTMIYTCAISG